MKRNTISLLLAFSMMGLCLWVAVRTYAADKQALPCRVPDHVESYTMGSLDRLQISKTYLIEPGEDPANISTKPFQAFGTTFTLSEMTKEQADGVDIYTVIFTEAEP